ncbi:MAG: phenylacetate--CoA ligase family protein, partial [Bacteroidales bacterium]|nr:phenylacetate--CoA ligase family protein [Bacteroidales bacterium]
MTLIPDIETKSRHEIEAWQNRQLADTLAYLQLKSVFYRNKFQKERIDTSKIITINDLQHISPSDKSDLFHHNQDFICVPTTEIRDYVTTSGTSGDPVTFALTDNDLERLAYNEAISFACAGAKSGD